LLSIYQTRAAGRYDSYRTAAELNKLIHLESLTGPSRSYLNNYCLSKLWLPALQHLNLYMVCLIDLTEERKPNFNHFKILFQYKKRPRITQATLDELAKHSKLLSIIGTMQSKYYERESKFILVRRLNSAASFRKMREIEKLIGYRFLKFDYDSVESGSDENSLEH
jgi:hypothetical protein